MKWVGSFSMCSDREPWLPCFKFYPPGSLMSMRITQLMDPRLAARCWHEHPDLFQHTHGHIVLLPWCHVQPSVDPWLALSWFQPHYPLPWLLPPSECSAILTASSPSLPPSDRSNIGTVWYTDFLSLHIVSTFPCVLFTFFGYKNQCSVG